MSCHGERFASESSNGTLNILIIDDNEDAGEILASLLRVFGHSTSYRSDGVSGIAAALAGPPDIIFLDLGMPGMDGYEVARRLRLSGQLADCKIIALTAWGDAATKSRTLAQGFDAHVTKPASVNMLMDAIDDQCR